LNGVALLSRLLVVPRLRIVQKCPAKGAPRALARGLDKVVEHGVQALTGRRSIGAAEGGRDRRTGLLQCSGRPRALGQTPSRTLLRHSWVSGGSCRQPNARSACAGRTDPSTGSCTTAQALAHWENAGELERGGDVVHLASREKKRGGSRRLARTRESGWSACAHFAPRRHAK